MCAAACLSAERSDAMALLKVIWRSNQREEAWTGEVSFEPIAQFGTVGRADGEG